MAVSVQADVVTVKHLSSLLFLYFVFKKLKCLGEKNIAQCGHRAKPMGKTEISVDEVILVQLRVTFKLRHFR